MEQRYAESARQYTLARSVERFEQMLEDEMRTRIHKLSIKGKRRRKFNGKKQTGYTTATVRHSTSKKRADRRIA